MILAQLIGDQISVADLVILGMAGILGIPALKNRRKDEVIKELKGVAEANERYISTLERDKEVVLKDRNSKAQEALEAERRAAGCQAAYDELSKYAAPEALSDVRRQLVSLESAIVTAVSSQGELVMKNTEVLTGIKTLLERENG
jgi:hypothetical protein